MEDELRRRSCGRSGTSGPHLRATIRNGVYYRRCS